MKLGSKYFDSIRAKSKPATGSPTERPRCQWRGCTAPGCYRAPKGRQLEGQFYLFCVDHVRQYNASYNYFDGMSPTEVEFFQKDAATGHRPTWKMGGTGGAGLAGRPGDSASSKVSNEGDPASADTAAADPHGFFAWRARQARDEPADRRRHLKPLEKKSLDCLHLGQAATKSEIKARFKELVKQHHPDLHGGDCRSEEKLREIIQAYNYLKQVGLV